LPDTLLNHSTLSPPVMSRAELETLLDRYQLGAPVTAGPVQALITPAMWTRLQSKSLLLERPSADLIRAAMIAGWRQMFGEELNSML